MYEADASLPNYRILEPQHCLGWNQAKKGTGGAGIYFYFILENNPVHYEKMFICFICAKWQELNREWGKNGVSLYAS